MEKTIEDNTDYVKSQYIKSNKKLINNLLNEYNYLAAFNSLLIVLKELNENDKKDFIDYYYDSMTYKYSLNGTQLMPVARF
jgi:hypothetical protein